MMRRPGGSVQIQNQSAVININEPFKFVTWCLSYLEITPLKRKILWTIRLHLLVGSNQSHSIYVSYICLHLLVNVGKYTMHGWYGGVNRGQFRLPFTGGQVVGSHRVPGGSFFFLGQAYWGECHGRVRGTGWTTTFRAKIWRVALVLERRWWQLKYFWNFHPAICISTPKFGEMVQFDEHIFQRGWFNHQLVIQGGLHLLLNCC